MRKLFLSVFAAAFIFCVCFAGGADASQLSFQGFAAGSGVSVGVPYAVNSGTERDPDTITLNVDLASATVNFQLTAVGTGFNAGTRVELDWDDDGMGSPRDQYTQVIDGGFSAAQSFSFNTSRLRLANGGTRSMMYELEADEKPHGARNDSQRHLRITFAASGTAVPPPATVPTTPVVRPALTFGSFTPGAGLALSGSYAVNSGTWLDPDTVTLLVDLSVPTLDFHITVTGTGFTNSAGRVCELDWDDDGLGEPRENYVDLVNGGFTSVQSFSLSTARLWLSNGQSRTILYELDADEKPEGARKEAERHLRITFVPSNAVVPTVPNPTLPVPTTTVPVPATTAPVAPTVPEPTLPIPTTTVPAPTTTVPAVVPTVPDPTTTATTSPIPTVTNPVIPVPTTTKAPVTTTTVNPIIDPTVPAVTTDPAQTDPTSMIPPTTTRGNGLYPGVGGSSGDSGGGCNSMAPGLLAFFAILPFVRFRKSR